MSGASAHTIMDGGPLFSNGVVALLPSVIAPMMSEHAARMADVDMARFGGVTAAMGAARPPYDLLPGGVARISLSGLLLQRPGLLLRILMGAADLVEFQSAVGAAGADPSVRAIVLAISSPGGVVNGPPEIAALIEEVGRNKPVVAWSDGMIASAAYWIASACHSIYVSGPTVTTGSIGVVAVHRYSPDPDGGVTTEITAGKLKSVASSNAPLSAEGREHIQARVDYLGGVFHQAVARGRGMSVSKVAGLEAGTFTGAQGVVAGLVDGIVTFDALVSDLAANPARYMNRRQPAPGAVHARTGVNPQHTAHAGVPAVAAAAAPSQLAPATPSVSVEPSLKEQKVQAAKCLNEAYAMHGPQFRILVQSVESWQAQAAARAKKDGCDYLTALKRVGFVHALVSFPPVGKPTPTMGKPSAASTAWAPFAVSPRYADSPPFSQADKIAAGQAWVDAQARQGGGFCARQRPAEEWNAIAGAFVQREGCSFVEALRLSGYVHPVLSVAVSLRG